MPSPEIANILKWDSEFFGFGIAGLEVNTDFILTQTLVEDWRQRGVRCVYINTPYHTGFINESKAEVFDADMRCLLKRNTRDEILAENVHPLIEMNDALIDLSLTAGRHSRFMRDKHFPEEKTKLLYETWIRQSLHGQMGDDIFVYGDVKHPLGFIAFTNKKTYLQIGLLAVAPEAANNGIAKKLLTAADVYARAHQLPYMILYTQSNNNRAQHIFAQNGFINTEEIHQYHVWI